MQQFHVFGPDLNKIASLGAEDLLKSVAAGSTPPVRAVAKMGSVALTAAGTATAGSRR